MPDAAGGDGSCKERAAGNAHQGGGSSPAQPGGVVRGHQRVEHHQDRADAVALKRAQSFSLATRIDRRALPPAGRADYDRRQQS